MFELAPTYPSRSDLDWCWYLRKQGAMGEAVERILHDVGVMNPSGWADWQPSTLTNTGAPVAMNFTRDQGFCRKVSSSGRRYRGMIGAACNV